MSKAASSGGFFGWVKEHKVMSGIILAVAVANFTHFAMGKKNPIGNAEEWLFEKIGALVGIGRSSEKIAADKENRNAILGQFKSLGIVGASGQWLVSSERSTTLAVAKFMDELLGNAAKYLTDSNQKSGGIASNEQIMSASGKLLETLKEFAVQSGYSDVVSSINARQAAVEQAKKQAAERMQSHALEVPASLPHPNRVDFGGKIPYFDYSDWNAQLPAADGTYSRLVWSKAPRKGEMFFLSIKGLPVEARGHFNASVKNESGVISVNYGHLDDQNRPRITAPAGTTWVRTTATITKTPAGNDFGVTFEFMNSKNVQISTESRSWSYSGPFVDPSKYRVHEAQVVEKK